MRAYGYGGFDGARADGPRARIARVLETVAAGMARLRSDLARPARNRRVIHRLSALSDRELKDIGLWRQDVRDAALPEIADASGFLVARREARRAASAALRRRR